MGVSRVRHSLGKSIVMRRAWGQVKPVTQSGTAELPQHRSVTDYRPRAELKWFLGPCG